MSDDMKYICDVIREVVSAQDVGRALGLNPGYDGRCKCFFHGGDHRNLKLYGPGRGYYCFVCHEHGDVIRLVMSYSKCDFMAAVEWLNDTFNLQLNLRRDNPYSRRRRAENYARKREREQKNADSS